MLKAQGVKRKFPISGGPDCWALKGVDVHAPRGELTILRGRSGSGKTTLMNILGALDMPTEGVVLFDGRDIVQMDEGSRTKLRRKEIGFVFQSVALIPMLSAYENVEYALRLSRFSGDRRERVRECLRMVGLEKRMHHMPQELSGGEQQRVAIARAMAHKPKVLFADEPTAELDTGTGLQVMRIFKDLCAYEGITVVMTTHDTGLMELGDVVYHLEDGAIVDG